MKFLKIIKKVYIWVYIYKYCYKEIRKIKQREDDYMNEKQLAKINKFESKRRIEELDIAGILKAAGFSDNMTLADIGSGTGLLVLEAQKYANSKIYSVEMSDTMIEIQKERIEEEKIKNIEIIEQNVDNSRINLDNQSCDVVTMITVFHEIDNKDSFVKEIDRILKPDGKFLVIEFHKKETGFGPPLDERLSSEDITEVCSKVGFEIIDNTVLGDNFYRVIIEKTNKNGIK